MVSLPASYFDSIGRDWQEAYCLANDGKPAPAIVWDRGWFLVDGHRYRRFQIQRMTKALRASFSETIG